MFRLGGEICRSFMRPGILFARMSCTSPGGRVRSTLRVLVCAIVGLTVSSVAYASPISWGPNVYDPVDILFSDGGSTCTAGSITSPCSTLDYVHDLTTNGFVPGLASDDQLSGGLLEIFVHAGDTDSAQDSYKFSLELGGLAALTSGSI